MWITKYDMFDSLQQFCDIEMEYVGGTRKRLWLVRILVLTFVIPEACTYSVSLCYEVGAWFIYLLSSLWVAVGDERWFFPTNLSP